MPHYPQQPAFVSPTRRRVPMEIYSPGQWKTATANTHLFPPICFDLTGRPRHQGVSMKDLRLQGTGAPIQGAGDPVLAYTGLQRVIFRIMWPGYGHIEWCRAIPVVAPNGAPITRVALAVQIATSFAHFIEKAQYETPSDRSWMVSPNCVRFEHLILISLQNTFEDVWQADVALDIC
ncbi:hypothetical protein R3P38DRAFT_2495973 [Favolaschia claudopus]|uniref:Uncharacterized protein n=1 Tax=Favolaschia claudopus TaxID=2862362 RepID=A0AAW0E520_9AGAR